MVRYENTSLERGMSILEALGEAGDPRTLTEIAGTVGLARSTTFRLLAVLKDLGFVHKDPRDGVYSLGFNAYRLGQTSRAVDALVRDAHPFLRALAHETGLTTYLAALEGPQVLICDVVQPPDALKLPFEVGMRIDAHVTAAGKALLAARPGNEIDDFYAAHAPRRYTARSAFSLDA
ncbi:MAG: IclR family transcriptional regulator, partial [Alphaproteobacteria bacterium]|nr:IclR family transcriptional regulator [Alphaproteobacteria bacterium]